MTKEVKKTPTNVEELTAVLKWRLSKAPTLEDVTTMLDKGIVTKEEARQILFNEVNEKQEQVEALKEQIEFLEKVVEKLASKQVTVNGWNWPSVTYVTTHPTKYWINSGSGLGLGTTYTVSGSTASLSTGAINAISMNSGTTQSIS